MISEEDLWAQKRFLIYHGKGGYDSEGIDRMTRKERHFHIEKLSDDLKRENEMHRQAAAKQQAAANRSRRRR